MLRYQKGYIFNGYTFVVDKADIHNAKDDQFVEATALLPDGWISVKERLPEEHDSIFAKRYDEGTQLQGMFRRTSDEVIVSGVFEDGGKFVTTKRTHDGVWHKSGIVSMTITHWMPLPEPPEEDAHD